MPKKFQPLSIGDCGAYIRRNAVAVRLVQVPTYEVLRWNITTNLIEVGFIHADDVAEKQVTGRPEKQYYVDGHHTANGPAGIAKTHASWLKSWALEHGATPDAIRLMTEAWGLTKKEQDEMAKAATKTKASKLAKKAGAAPADDTAKPVGGGGKAASTKAGRKGNPDALAKARAARAENAGPDTRKIKITNKENPYREGSNRAASFDALKGAKTVEDYKSAGGKTKYLSRWAEEGRISLG